MKYFIVSDIHGHYKELKQALVKAHFNPYEERHRLIVLGDMFDRSEESRAVYKFIKNLCDKGYAYVVRRNHEKFLIDYLDGTSINPFNYLNNGTKEKFAAECEAAFTEAIRNGRKERLPRRAFL